MSEGIHVSLETLIEMLNEKCTDDNTKMQYLLRICGTHNNIYVRDVITPELFAVGDITRQQIKLHFYNERMAFVMGVWKKSCAEQLAQNLHYIFEQCDGNIAFDPPNDLTYVAEITS